MIPGKLDYPHHRAWNDYCTDQQQQRMKNSSLIPLSRTFLWNLPLRIFHIYYLLADAVPIIMLLKYFQILNKSESRKYYTLMASGRLEVSASTSNGISLKLYRVAMTHAMKMNVTSVKTARTCPPSMIPTFFFPSKEMTNLLFIKKDSNIIPINVLSQLIPPIAYPKDPPNPAIIVNVLNPSAWSSEYYINTFIIQHGLCLK